MEIGGRRIRDTTDEWSNEGREAKEGARAGIRNEPRSEAWVRPNPSLRQRQNERFTRSDASKVHQCQLGRAGTDSRDHGRIGEKTGIMECRMLAPHPPNVGPWTPSVQVPGGRKQQCSEFKCAVVAMLRSQVPGETVPCVGERSTARESGNPSS